jgi:N-methylhydantoinase A
MGGTSTDVSLCDGEIKVTREIEVDGMPVGVPMMDVHTVGAGGGSIAELDPGGALKVGPESAGADPGPICYGKGDRLTVTDANLILGRLRPEFFLGGAMKLSTDRITPALARMEWTAGWKNKEALAQGVIDVVKQQHGASNPVDFRRTRIRSQRVHAVLLRGAAGLHAATLARALGMKRVVVPRFPGALSALGLLLADARKDYSRTLLVDAEGSSRELKTALAQLHKSGFEELKSEGFARRDIGWTDFVDLRYRGQSYELTVELTGDFIEGFHHAMSAAMDMPIADGQSSW